jgi:hypothetical protein
MKKASLFVTLILLLGLGLLTVAQTAQQTAPKVKVGTQLTTKANAPAPSAATTERGCNSPSIVGISSETVG